MATPFLLAFLAGALALHAAAIGLQLPGAIPAGRSAPRWTCALAGAVSLVPLAIALSLAKASAIDILVLAAGFLLGSGAAFLSSSLRPLDPDRPFLPGESARWASRAIAIEREPDAGAVLLTGPHPSGLFVVICHGGGNDRLYGLWRLLPELLERGCSVLTAHLAGHGRGGSDLFSLDASRRRIDELIACARAQPGCRSVVLLGQSMGAVLSLDAAARGVAVDGVIAVSPLTELRLGASTGAELGAFAHRSIYLALRHGTLPRLLPAAGSFKRAAFPVRVGAETTYVEEFALVVRQADLVRRLAASARFPRLLLVLGEQDAIAPASQGLAIHQAIPGRSQLLLIPGAYHLDVLLRADVVSQIAGWLATIA